MKRLIPTPSLLRIFQNASCRSTIPSNPLVAAAHTATPELVVTGSMNPDIARNVPVISLASAHVVGIYARLGDTVHKGQ
jgi:hypothetical protein